MAKPMKAKAAPRVVAAAMTAASVRGNPMVPGSGKSLASEIEDAMIEAVKVALSEGVSIENSDEIIRRKHLARGRVLRRHGRPIPTEVEAAERT